MDWIDEMFGGGDSATPTNELQRTEEWFRQRKTKLTGSTYPALMTNDRNGHLSHTAMGVIWDKIQEIRGNRKFIENDATRWGVEHEPLAFKVISSITGIRFKEVGFYSYKGDSHGYKHLKDRIGGSPDGLSLEYALELKCPYSEKVFKSYKEDPQKLVKQYYWQVVSHMIFTKTDKAILAAYDPRTKQSVIETLELKKEHVNLLMDRLSESINILDFLNKRL